MRVKGRDSINFSSCGMKVVGLSKTGTSGAYIFQCRRWSCTDCKKEIIAKHIDKTYEIFRHHIVLY
jgi:hypothetical protein